MKTGEYAIHEMKTMLDSMSGMYDLARVVDPVECRVLEFHDDGTVSMDKKCYGIWNAEQKCANCSSAVACKTGCHQEKSEFFQDHLYHIHSNPVKLKLPDGGSYNAVVELVSRQSVLDGKKPDGMNDKEAENKADAAMRFRALHDSLTGILKADAFYEQARELLTEHKDASWTMVVGDIMEFRLFNSLFGVEKGNEVLLKTAGLLQHIADSRNGICCRLYRDKFALLLPTQQFDEADFSRTAKHINEAFTTGVYTIRLHFGVYETVNHDLPVSVMCDRANMALKPISRSYRKNISYFDHLILQKSIDEQKIISSFDTALSEGQFKIYLQPLVYEDGSLFGAEALTRWVTPDHGMISPAAFIPVLEDAGLIHKLDVFIWEEAVKQLSLWKGTEKEELSISVNMSAKDFYSIDIYQVLIELTEKYGVDHQKLRVEITESTLIEDPKNIYPILRRLQDAGFLIEIDDFGKGQSSLSLLKDIHADILKIDMCFLQETENEHRSAIILKSVIAMAKELGMQVITEGVETKAQLLSLTSMGCRHFQGFYFSRPLPIDEFEKIS